MDYALIADNDPGMDLADAFASMSAETVAATPKKLMSYIDIANEVGFAESSYLEGVVNAAIDAAMLPSWVRSCLENNGIDVNNIQTGPLLDSLVAGPFTQTMADAIKASGVVFVKKYDGLTPAILRKARIMRSEDRI